MKNCMIDPMEEKTLSGLLDNLENEAEYMECINDEEEYANGMRYVIEITRRWYEQAFVEVNLFRRNGKF